MDFLGARIPQQAHQLAGGGASDDGVINDHHPLAVDGGAQGVELELYRLLPAGLVGLDEGAPHIAVFDQPVVIRYTGLHGVALGGVQP